MRAPEFWASEKPAARAFSALLSPLGALYGLSVKVRGARAHRFRAKARVLCVGNLTAGGTGKTPLAIALGRMLTGRGKRIVFLTRGYGGRLRGPVAVDSVKHSAADVGDEALLLAAVAPTIVAHNRAGGAELADRIGADVIVMDDGFQNFQLAKDISLVVVDAEAGFGNGRLIPAGPLREPVEDGLKRADAVVLMGDGSPKLPPFHGPIFRARLLPSAADVIAGRAVVAIAGIGQPEKFFSILAKVGARVVIKRAFPDHHRFTKLEIDLAKGAAKTAGAILVTTQKDFVRLDVHDRKGIVPFPVHAVLDDGAGLAALLDRLDATRA